MNDVGKTLGKFMDTLHLVILRPRESNIAAVEQLVNLDSKNTELAEGTEHSGFSEECLPT